MKHDKEVEEFHDDLNFDFNKIEQLSQIGKIFKQHILEAQADNCVEVITQYGCNILIDRTLLDNTNEQIDKIAPWKIGKFNKYSIDQLVSQQFLYQDHKNKRRKFSWIILKNGLSDIAKSGAKVRLFTKKSNGCPTYWN